VGVWGTDLFADDMACDVRDHYRELLEDGVEDAAAMGQTVGRFRAYLDEPEGVGLLAFAVTQSKLGRLDPAIRDRALAVIDRGADLTTWERDNPKLLGRRRAMLEKVRAQLSGPQPPRRRLRPPTRVSSGLAAGDVLAFTLPRRVALLRVVRVRPHRRGETPVLEELACEGLEVPSRDALERLAAKVDDPIAAVDPLSPGGRFFAFVMQRVDWQRAGFRKVHTIGGRAGDERAPVPTVGVSWAQLAERYRRRAAP
jgi:hypothetical protein